ncbi:MAG TPA: peptide chain release factor 1 [Roseiflexaceae bacterium]|jgi:peptide chain release factor 1|nr:peptide chain release factor 1 [Roseiflexaceae bacterium]
MFNKLTSVEDRYNELSEMMAQPDVVNDYQRLQQLAREQRELEEVVAAFREYTEVQRQIDDTQMLLNDGADPEMRELAQEELDQLRAQVPELEERLKILLLPRDPNDQKNVIIEIRQGEGGDEAALFAADLFRMFTRYAEDHGWKSEVVNVSENGVGGFKEVVFEIAGEGAYSRLKYEGGVHRVQRVPATEARGRIHTSTATVAVLPEVEDTDVELKAEDYRVDVYRSGGHGGQGVNTTDSAVRIVYRGGTPEEIVVTCQDTRSQLKNKDQALNVLRAKLFAREEERRRRELGESRLAQVGTGERAEKIRTYNFPQDRVTDHRIGQSFSNLPGLLNGDLDRMIDALIVADNAQRLEAVGMS